MKFDEIFARDAKREQGAWVRTGFRDLPGLALKVRGDNNADQMKRAAELWSAATPQEREAPDFETEMQKTLLLDTILLDWNIEDRPFDRESAREALETSTFRQAVEYASRVVASLGVATLEADAKN